jgi:voltage-dependent anion channel protein 2
LSKDYKVGKATVEVKSKTPSGITFTPTANKDNSSGKVEGSLKAAYGFLPWLDGECTMGTAGTVSVSLEAANALTKGLTLTAECDRAVGKTPAKANLIADYKTELFACKSSYDYYKKDLLGANMRAAAATADGHGRSPRACPATSHAHGACIHRPCARRTCAASCSTVYAGCVFGLDGAYSTTKGSLAKYSAACQFVQPDFAVSGKLCASRRPRASP